MAPLVISEDQVFTFKFWFNDLIQTGMYYQNELFCCLGTFTIRYRPRVYQLGCQLTHRKMHIIITSNHQECSLWGSLRDAAVREILFDPDSLTLPNLDEVLAEEVLANNPSEWT